MNLYYFEKNNLEIKLESLIQVNLKLKFKSLIELKQKVSL